MVKNPRVAHLTSVHPYRDTRIFLKECRTLASAGYETHLVAPGAPEEMLCGVRLHGIPAPCGGRLARMTGTVRGVYQVAKRLDAEVYHFHDPELIFVGMRLARQGKRVIYDAHEYVPHNILDKAYIPRPVRRPIALVADGIERLAATRFARIVAPTPKIASRFPPRKTVLIHNYPIPGELATDVWVPQAQRPKLAVYVGSITVVRGLCEVVRAYGLLDPALGIRMVVGGDFSPPELETELKRLPGGAQVEFPGWLSREEVSRLFSEARVGIVTFLHTPAQADAYPTKLFEYMEAGLPIITSHFLAWREFVEGTGCGLMVDPANPQAIADAIRWIIERPHEAEEMGRRGMEAVRTRYNWNNEAPKLLNMYREITRA